MRVSRRELQYLLAIKAENERGNGATVFKVARTLRVSTASAYEEISHLMRKGLVCKREDGIYVTEYGLKILNNALRAHRVLETLLVSMGFNADEACKLASEFDYAVPEEVVNRLYEYLGKPKRCPHGYEIPDAHT